MNKILVTGGSGFIGTNVVEYYLSKGAFILNIDIKPPKRAEQRSCWKNVDILDFDKLKSAVLDFGPDYIIHLAARANLTGSDLSDYIINIEGVEHVIKIGNEIESVKKIMFTSTMLVCEAGYIPKGDTDYCPPNLYGESKAIGEEIVRKKASNFEWVIVRPTSIWGPWFGATYRRFFEMIINRSYFNFTGEMSTKTYGFIGNIVYQIDAILQSERSNCKTLYLGDYEPTNIKKWSKEIANELNLKIITVPRIIIKTAAICGDLFQGLNLKFPLNSFRFRNMTTNNIIPMDETKKIAPEVKFSRIEGNRITLNWMRTQKE